MREAFLEDAEPPTLDELVELIPVKLKRFKLFLGFARQLSEREHPVQMIAELNAYSISQMVLDIEIDTPSDLPKANQQIAQARKNAEKIYQQLSVKYFGQNKLPVSQSKNSQPGTRKGNNTGWKKGG